MGRTKLLAMFTGLDLIATILVWLVVPETEELMTFEKMTYVIGFSTWQHIQYQAYTVLPYMIRPRLCLGTKGLLPPLYTWHTRQMEIEKIQRHLNVNAAASEEESLNLSSTHD